MNLCWRSRNSDVWRIAGDSICRGWIAIVSLSLDERVVHERGRALERISGWRVAGDRLSADGAEQISKLRVSDSGLGHEHGDGAIRVETSVGHSNLRLSQDENGRDTGVGERAVLERHRAILIAGHSNVVHLVRWAPPVPGNPPSAVLRYGRQIKDF